MTDTALTSIRRRLRLMVLSLLAVLSCTSLILHEQHARTDERIAHDSAVRLLAEAFVVHLRSVALDDPNALRTYCRTTTTHPAVLAAAIWDGSGRLVAGGEREDGVIDSLTPPSLLTAGAQAIEEIQLSKSPKSGSSVLRLAEALPFGAGEGPWSFGMLLSPSQLAAHTRSALWPFYIPLLAMTVVLGWIATVFVTRTVCAPLSTLLQVMNDECFADHEADLARRTDEWSTIAGHVRRLGDQLTDSREKVQNLERRMRTQIAEETRRITRDLHQAQRESWLDPLTRLKNRRLLEDRFPAIYEAQKRQNGDLSVVLFDLDHFKQLNDTLGHRAGDDILVFAGELLRQCSRGDDLAIRYGGDELLLILPGMSASHAVGLARRISALFTQRARMMFTKVRPPTMTAGIASLVQDRPKDHLDLIHLADNALYAAKRIRRRHEQKPQAGARTTPESQSRPSTAAVSPL